MKTEVSTGKPANAEHGRSGIGEDAAGEGAAAATDSEAPQGRSPNQALRNNRRAAVLLGAVAIALVTGIRVPTPSPPLSPELPADRRKLMPGFTLPALDGQPWSLSQHRGHVVLLNFWATWCPPCQAETPGLVKIARDYQTRGLDVAGIAMDAGNPATVQSNVRAFVSAYRVPYPILSAPAFSPLTGWVQAYPTTLLIDRQGRTANAVAGRLDETSTRKEVERLLSEQRLPHSP